MITWCCKPDCPGRHPACHGTCEKYKAWAAQVKAEKAYTKNAVYRDKVNRDDYEKEGWMAHKGQRKQRKNDRNGPQAIKPGGFGDKRQGVPGGVQRTAAL